MAELHSLKTGKGPDLVLLHGWGSSSKIWQPCVGQLSRDFRVWCVDLPGHGGSHAIKWDYGTEQGVEMLAKCLPQTCTIIGWSLGGLLAQLFTKQLPHRVARMMLVASAPKFVADPQWPDGMRMDNLKDFSQQYVHAPQRTLKKFCALQVVNTESARRTLELLNTALSNQQRHLEKITWGLQWLQQTDVRADTILHSLPVRLLHGGKDQVLPVNTAKRTITIWENARLEIVSGAGHAPFISHPNHFLRWVDRSININ